MKIKLTAKKNKKFHKQMCKHFDAKLVYTGGIIGKIYKRIVLIPFVKKLCLKADSGDPETWLDGRIITVGNYIFMNYKPGKYTSHNLNWEEAKINGHELTHVIRQRKEGSIDWNVKYVKEDAFRAREEFEAVKFEIFIDIWNEVPVKSISYYVNSLSQIYSFDKKTLISLEKMFETLMQEYRKHGRKVLINDVSAYAIKILPTL